MAKMKSQLIILKHLYRGDKLPVSVIRDRTLLTTSNLHTLLQTAVRNGWVTFEGKNNKTRFYFITDAGKEKYDREARKII